MNEQIRIPGLSPRTVQEVLQKFPSFKLFSLTNGEAIEVSSDSELAVQTSFSGLTLDSRQVQSGDLFLALSGELKHGAGFVAKALELGASTILTDNEGLKLLQTQTQPKVSPVAVLVDPSPRTVSPALAAWLYKTETHYPPVLGVTGSNGKTTVIYCLDRILRLLGQRTGFSTTASRKVVDTEYGGKLTTPEAIELQAFLGLLNLEEVNYGLIEVSAQALTRGRVAGMKFSTVGFTNLSRNHVEDYATEEKYLLAKAELFDPNFAQRGVINLESNYGIQLRDSVKIPTTTLALANSNNADQADWIVELNSVGVSGSHLTISNSKTSQHLQASTSLLGSHMAQNLAVAIVMLIAEGIDFEALKTVLADNFLDFSVPGRMHPVNSDGPTVIVDYGHNPEALKVSLAALREVHSGQLIVVTGGEGNRDTTKRGPTGAAAALGSDLFILTDDEPRDDDPAEIRAAVYQGAVAATSKDRVIVCPDPAEAIRLAVSKAGTDGLILWAGMGAASNREVAGEFLEFAPLEQAKAALEEAGWKLQ